MDEQGQIKLVRSTVKVIWGTVYVLVMLFGTWLFTGGLRRLVRVVTYKWDE